MRSGKDIAVAQSEKEPGVDLHAAVPVFAGTVASYIIFIGIIAAVSYTHLGAYDLKEMHRIVNALPRDYKVPFSCLLYTSICV